MRLFKTEDMLRDAFSLYAQIETLEGSDDPDTQTKIIQLYEELAEKYPELAAIELLQRQRLTSLKQPKIAFCDSGLDWKAYVLQEFSEAIEAGFLPVDQIEDPDLRKIISSEISRGTLPPELEGICQTKQQMLDARREAIARIAAFENGIYTRDYARFARGLVSQRRPDQ